MADTFVKIASVTVGSGGSSSIAFSSIPQTYTDLVVKVSARTTGSSNTFDGIKAKVNGTLTGLTSRVLYGVGTGAGSNTDVAVSGGESSSSTATASTFGNSEIYFSNYTSSNYKSFSTDGVSETNATSAAIVMTASLMSNTAAITSLELVTESGGNFVQYSTATLYGIKNS